MDKKRGEGVSRKSALGYVTKVRDHPYITSAKGLGGWSQKIAIFADVQ